MLRDCSLNSCCGCGAKSGASVRDGIVSSCARTIVADIMSASTVKAETCRACPGVRSDITVLPALERPDVARHFGGGSLGATSEIGVVRAFFSGTRPRDVPRDCEEFGGFWTNSRKHYATWAGAKGEEPSTEFFQSDALMRWQSRRWNNSGLSRLYRSSDGKDR